MIRRLLLLAGPVALLAQEAPAPGTPAPAAAQPVTIEAPATPPVQVLGIPEPGRFKQLFEPFRTNAAVLSPDGKYLAYALREGETLSVGIVDLDQLQKKGVRVLVVDDDGATPMMAINQREKTPGRINWMSWVTPTRLLVETNQVFSRGNETTGWQSWRGAVIGLNADGTGAKLLANPRDVVEFVGETGGGRAFSTARSNSPGFDARVARPDRPTPSADAGTTGAVQLDASLPSPDAEPEMLPPPTAGIANPRSLRVFDFDPQRPEAVTLLVTGGPRDSSHSLSLYSLNALTGKLTDLNFDLVANNRITLVDRQGRPRLTLSNTLLSSFPLRYEYLGPNGKNRPRSLDDVAGFPGFTVSPGNYFGERAIPLGFDEGPNVLYYASNLGRDTYGIYSLDLTTKKSGSLKMENAAYDLVSPPVAGFPDQGTLVFDRFTRQLAGVRYTGALRTATWLRPEWQAMQTQLEQALPGRSVEISDWDEAGRRFIVSTESPADPGAFYLYDREQNKLFELVRRSPWIDANHLHATLPFSYATTDGARVSGLVTVPQQPRLKPIPMVVLCPDWPWQRVSPDFQAEVQALAGMGFVVVQLNGRGAWGLGLKQRQSLTAGYDLVQVEDVATTVTNLEKIFNVNPKRVALFGRGHGGFIALRALQAHPDKFRCAIAIDAPINLGDWLTDQKWSSDDVLPQLTRAWLGDAARLKAAPLDRQPEAITKPILLLAYPGLAGEPRRPVYLDGQILASRVRRAGATAEFEALTPDYMSGLPAARAAVFDRIEEFLNTHIYDFNVKLRDLKVIKEGVTTP